MQNQQSMVLRLLALRASMRHGHRQLHTGFNYPIAALTSSTACDVSSVSWNCNSLASQTQQLGLLTQTRWQCNILRSFASQPAAAAATKVKITADVLQQVQVLRLRELLDDEADTTLHVPLARFVELSKQSGAAQDDLEAEELCSAMHKAGVILRHNDTVYLRAEEIAEMVTALLPGGKEDAKAKLDKVEAELAALDAVHEAAEKRSHTLTNVFLTTGLLILTTQFVAFIYLTWWELSWDVMEPIAYIISLFYSIVGYVYFLATRGNTFDLEPFKQYWSQRLKEKKIAQLQFDADRYAHLKRLQARYLRALKSVV